MPQGSRLPTTTRTHPCPDVVFAKRHELIMSKMYDPEESLAEGLAKEGGVRPNGRPALRRYDNEYDV